MEEKEKQKYICDYSQEEWDKLTDKQIDKIKRCSNYYCFECYGDR